MRGFSAVAVLLLVLAVGLAILWRAYPDALDNEASQERLIYLGALLAIFAFYIAASPRIRLGETVRNIGIWLLVAGALAAIYVNIDSIRGHLSPTQPVSDNGVVTLRRSMGGHFHTMAEVNGQRLNMMIDTGASMIALPYEDARKVGIDVESLRFIRTVQTANGEARDAPVRLEEVRVGEIVLRNVAAGVAEPGRLDTPLLGMSFLDRLQSYSFTRDTLTLTR